ncbi:hypothetical protein BGZ94_009049 [Podila epigama]|nr:hypothetical protein BGZ94_009049 [Podila epigama]
MQLSATTPSISGPQQSLRFLFWGVSAAVLALAVLRQVFDPANKTRCESLLNHGSWLDPQRTNWQPKGCMLKTYDPKSTASCIEGSRVVMIGDSVARQLYYSVVKKIIPDANTKGDRHSDIFFRDEESGATFEFYWDPVLNSTRASELISQTTRNSSDGIEGAEDSLDPHVQFDQEHEQEQDQEQGQDQSPPEQQQEQQQGQSQQELQHHAPQPQTQLEQGPIPSILLVGSGLWYLRYAEWSGGKDEWQSKMRSLIQRMSEPRLPRLADNLFISPISAVNTEKLSEERLQTIRPKDIEDMNTFLREETQTAPITIPFTWNLMTKTAESATKDGLHYVERVMTAEADILLNFLCNNKLPKVAPMAATCCYDYPSNRWYQTLMLAIFLLWIPTGIIIQTFYRDHPASPYFPSLAILKAMAIMAGAVAYMYFSDRTSLFGKSNKMYSTPSFVFLMALSVAAGCLSLKKADKDQVFLNRDQTDEWKGWMQIVILIYHYMGASSVSVIYNPVRMLVASYLFMTGFGHFIFFYKKADFGFVRVASILTRLNLLTVLLTYTMDTTYISYYFAPLVSFFYLIIYGMMYIGHAHNKKPVFMLSKIVITAVLTAACIQTPVVLDTIFACLRFFFSVTWSVTEWRFRLQLDVWIVFIGALFAYGFIKAQEMAITAHPQWSAIKSAVVTLSAVGLLGYFIFEATVTKFEYNVYHPHISWIPILSFVILRNSTASLRNTTSTVYSFIGKCSLETFIGQFHMWLAGDTKGILVISPWIEGPGAWMFNLVLSSVIFVVVAHTLSGATGVLSDWLITGREPKQSKNNFVTTPYTLATAGPLSSCRDRESSPGLPLTVKRQSVMISPIAASAGAVGPSKLKSMMESSLLAEQTLHSSRDVELTSNATHGDVGGSNNLGVQSEAGTRLPKEHDNANKSQGDSVFDSASASASASTSGGPKGSKGGKGPASKKPESVVLQINTMTVGRTRPQVVVSASSPTEVTLARLWAQPVWKVTIFFGVIWVMNYLS